MESFDDFIKNKNHSLPEKEDLNVEVVLEAMRRCTLSEKHLEKTNLSKTEIEISRNNLLSFQKILEIEISDWALDESFFIYNDEDDAICRLFLFSRGLIKNIFIVGASRPLIKFVNRDIDTYLFFEISNLLLDTLVNTISEMEVKPSFLSRIGGRIKRAVSRTIESV